MSHIRPITSGRQQEAKHVPCELSLIGPRNHGDDASGLHSPANIFGRWRRSIHLVRIAMAAALAVQGIQAQVTLPRLFTDHMVVQRNLPIHVWGLASPREAVAVTFGSDSAEVTADSLGRWSVQLPAHPAGGPYKLTVDGRNSLLVNDILVGDLWMASGQSNMEMPLSGFTGAPVRDSAAEIASADYPQIRLLHVRKAHAEYPLDDLADAVPWQVCTPATAASFSAVAYFFGRNIYQHEKVPIGLIDSSWGGTPAEAWTSLNGLSHSGILGRVMQARAADMDAEESLLLKTKVNAEAVAAGTLPKPSSDSVVPWEPAALYNGMIAPFVRFPIRGILWYQGESNGSDLRAPAYQAVLETLIQDWRDHWKLGDLPFLFVQIASHGSPGQGWPLVREGERRTLRMKNTGMAVAIDVGEEKQIHPSHKQEIGNRLALQALSIAYGDTVVKDGPVFRQATPIAGGLRLAFDSANGLKTADGSAPGNFELAGQDGVFSAATATIEGESVLVKSPKIVKPLFVRYAWQGFPRGPLLFNGADLPASPFSTQPVATVLQ